MLELEWKHRDDSSYSWEEQEIDNKDRLHFPLGDCKISLGTGARAYL